jgi:protein SCO1/2
LWRSIIVTVLVLVIAVPVSGQQSGQLPRAFEGVGLDERLGDGIPMDTRFVDSEGRSVTIGDYFDGERPVLLNFVYHSCPMLCSLLLEELTAGLKDVSWTPGKEFRVVTVSFASFESPDLAAQQKNRYLAKLGRSDAESGWTFLTGSEEDIAALTEAIGFSFKWVQESQEFAHPSVLVFLSGDGVITRYVMGMDYPAPTIEMALREASVGTIASAIDRLILYCYQFDPNSNTYVVHATNVMKMGGFVTVLFLATVLGVFWRRERSTNRPVAA